MVLSAQPGCSIELQQFHTTSTLDKAALRPDGSGQNQDHFCNLVSGHVERCVYGGPLHSPSLPGGAWEPLLEDMGPLGLRP